MLFVNFYLNSIILFAFTQAYHYYSWIFKLNLFSNDFCIAFSQDFGRIILTQHQSIPFN